MKILISGFTPFSSHTENSSQMLTELLKETKINGFDIKTVILPVTFSSSFDHLKVEIDSFKPEVVICLGLANNRQVISLEKVAINLIHCEIPDNEGVVKKDVPVMPDGPAAYFATLPLSEMLKVEHPFKVDISFSAGAYVCNYIMYRLLDYLKGSKVKAGFIHLPHLNNNQQDILESIIILIQSLKS